MGGTVCPSRLRRRVFLAETALGGVLAASAATAMGSVLASTAIDRCQHSLTALALSCLPWQYTHVMVAIDHVRHRHALFGVGEVLGVRPHGMAYVPGSSVQVRTSRVLTTSGRSAS